MQRYFALDKHDCSFLLDKGDIHHIVNVMRMKNGDLIEVVFDSLLYKCRVSIDNEVRIVLVEQMNTNYSNNMAIVLIVPVLKEQKMDLVLQKATELGVYKIIPIITERTIVKINDEAKKLDRWKRIVKEASEQCKRVDIPIIDNIKKIDDLCFDDGVKIVCSTIEKEKNIKNVMQTNKKCAKMYIVVGPEGGLSTIEEKKLNELGFASISLGQRIMRVETVPLFVLSALNYEFLE